MNGNKSAEYLMFHPGNKVVLKVGMEINCNNDVDMLAEHVREFLRAGLRFRQRRGAIPATA